MADLWIGDDVATDAEIAAVDDAIGDALGDGPVTRVTDRLVRSGIRRRAASRHLLLPALHALQSARGWISPGGVAHVAELLQAPPAEIYGVASFYDMFLTSEPDDARSRVHVCVDPACALAGAADLAGRHRDAGEVVVEGPCLGQCERAPALFVQGVAEPDRVPADDAPADPLPQGGDPSLRLLRRVGVVDPASLDDYRAHGGYRALDTALDIGPDAVIERVTAAGLSGRGGAAFPTGVKWRAVRDAGGETAHVVANGDESEPGTFKDRVVMERDPFALVEAMTIAAVTTGAQNGWIYIRGEYPLATARLAHAIDSAREAGLLGSSVAGSSHAFDIELRRGAGAYICGEETALFNSLEGERGEPRNKPPFPTTHGLFGQPTVINNPETLLNVLEILDRGVDGYREVGTEESPGTKLLCLSGRVGTPGLYEVPFGTTLGGVLRLAGANLDAVRAILLGGAAGSFAGPEHLDLPLTLGDVRAAGLSLGSGVVMAFDRDDDLAAVVTRLAAFFRHESCGQCVPCRIGTERQHELVVQITSGNRPTRAQVSLLGDLDQAMVDASICGLGHTAGSAVRSAVERGLLGEAQP